MRNFKKAIGFLVFMFLVLTAIPSASYAAGGQQATDVWKKKAPMSTSRANFETEVIDGKIYAMSGGDIKGKSNAVEVYDPAMNTWTTLEPMITARVNFQTEVVNGKLYSIGGYIDGGANHTNLTEVYDPDTNTCASLSPMSTGRARFQTEVINGKIYALGGYTKIPGSTTSCLNSLEVYDPTTNKWTSLAPMSTGRAEIRTAIKDGKIYVMGGITYDNAHKAIYLKTVEVYDPSTDKWTSLASMSKNRQDFQTEVINGKIYAIGGIIRDLKGSGTYTNLVDVYDPAIDTWRSLAPMLTAKGLCQTQTVAGQIYAIGGNLFNGSATINLNTTEVYNPSTNTWTSLASMFTAKSGFCTEVLGDEIYAIGGYNFSDSVEAYTVKLDKLSAPANLSALAGNAQVTLTWGSVEGATSYNIKRSEKAGGPYTTISSVSGSAITFTDKIVEPGTTYYYVITAINKIGESANSNEVSATPTAPVNVLKLVLEVKEQKQLSVSDDLGKNTDMTWTSLDPTIAIADENGLLKALKPGNTVITCISKDGDYTEAIKVLVVDLELQLSVDLKIGETCRLTVDDLKNITNVTWATYESAIATVTNKGKVTAVSEGLTYITATDGEGKEIGRIYIRVRNE